MSPIVSRLLVCMLTSATSLGFSSALFASDVTELQQQAIRAAATTVADAVVQIETIGGLEKVERILIGTAPTTGLIVSTDGYIVSSAFNFLQQPSSVLVGLANGQRHPARIVARDRSRMLVLLKIDVPEPLVVPTAAPRDSLQVGQTTVAVGKTFTADQVNLSTGILSATNRIWGRAVQTDAKISPANYGGPLVDLQGRVIGVLVPLSPDSDADVAGAEWYDSGIGFAVPLVDIFARLPRWQQGQDLVTGKLGITIKDQESFDPEPVIGVVKLKSPAAAAGIQPGDRVLSLNGQPVERFSQLRHALLPLYAEDSVTLLIRRGEETHTLTATLAAEIPPYESAFLGILPDRRAAESPLTVRYVYPQSPAAQLGLQVGDQLRRCADQPCESPTDLRRQLANLAPGNTVHLVWQRGDKSLEGDAVLSSLPTEVPGDVPAVTRDSPERPLDTGELTVRIPEEPNRCTAYLPASLKRDVPTGLLMILTPPGSTPAKDLIAQWQVICDRHDLVLLVPEPASDNRWQPTEVRYIRKLIDHARTQFGVDSARVALYGSGIGGALADLVAQRHREAVRAVAFVGAVPRAVRTLENEPLNPLAFLFVRQASKDEPEQLPATIDALREAKFPVSELPPQERTGEVTEDERADIGRWVDSLDRI